MSIAIRKMAVNQSSRTKAADVAVVYNLIGALTTHIGSH